MACGRVNTHHKHPHVHNTSPHRAMPHRSARHRPELAWLFANHDFKEYFKGCGSPDFGYYSDKRYCVYEHDPNAHEHGCVRFTYRDDLLPHESGTGKPEFKPYVYNEDGQ